MSKKRCIWRPRANSFQCAGERHLTSDYCTGHICNYNGCSNENRCVEHICIECLKTGYSNEMRFRGSKYCRIHVCGINGCLNNYNCKIHKCKNANCFDPIFDNNSKYCAYCICLQPGCGKDKYCNIHMCKCGFLVRIPGYSTCKICLPNILDAMLFNDVYFGMIPRDIVGILKKYL